MNSVENLLQAAQGVLDQLAHWLPPVPPVLDWDTAVAFRWHRVGQSAYLQALPQTGQLQFDDLQHILTQKARLEQNTRQFVAGKPANNVLLTGARGTGKSSLIRACLHQFAAQGLRLVEIDRSDLHDLPDLMQLLATRPERFIIFCDDLSFETGDAAYKALKVALDGSLVAQSERILIYATSNRRHLMPENMADNAGYQHDDKGDLHPGETVEERISLSERFGLWLSFYPFKQDDYLDIVAHWMRHYGCDQTQIDAAREEALQWALQRASRSGRVALQFARDYAGRHA